MIAKSTSMKFYKSKIFIFILVSLISIIGILVIWRLSSIVNTSKASEVQASPTISLALTQTVIVTPTATVSLTPTKAPATTTAAPTTTVPITTDKWIYFPVDRSTALSESFVPNNLVNLSQNGIPTYDSNFQMRREVINDLKNMIADAKVGGINLKISSPYRSYQDQVNTYNYWVNTEKAKGLSQSEAEAQANTYSAKPGHSEHQLGSTLDLNDASAGYGNLDSNPDNDKAWEWVGANLEKYGFVLSYPKGKDDKTGYIYEPWHIRWVGKEVAANILKTDYKNPTLTNTSTSYLKIYWNQLNS